MPGTPVTGTIVDIGLTVAYTVKNTNINMTASGETTIVSLVASKKIRVLSMAIFPISTATNLSFKSATGTTILNAMTLAANEGFVVPDLSPGWVFETTAGEALLGHQTVASNTRGIVNYIEV